MSGSKGGVHALLCIKELEKILYTDLLWCGRIEEFTDMFASCNILHKLFRLKSVEYIKVNSCGGV